MADAADQLAETFERVTTIIDHYRRDAPFRAPETVPYWQATTLNSIWSVLQDVQEKTDA